MRRISAGTIYQIDGAPTDADLYGLLAELSESLQATTVSATDPKFLRFAGRVLGKKNNADGPPRTELGATAPAGTITFNAVVGAILSPIPSDWFKGSPGTASTKTAKASSSTRTREGSEHDLRLDLLSAIHQKSSKATMTSSVQWRR